MITTPPPQIQNSIPVEPIPMASADQLVQGLNSGTIGFGTFLILAFVAGTAFLWFIFPIVTFFQIRSIEHKLTMLLIHSARSKSGESIQTKPSGV